MPCLQTPCLIYTGKYKLVTFAHRELNLHKVFWEVQSRGGYQAVCATKQWKVRGICSHKWSVRCLEGLTTETCSQV